ncbi:hypothetical protein H6G89_15335 [Oscillatoria sp. FACHB-1407]|uniref:hypothetical protein n=1 Tax=Oscillatoria sp. FACHB-1407 TaxID=2692847 RepID=UPI00168491E9|nr:hypothetical protein [Oscillatoria sp. FACHB-1407]MBD2462419.1 hypothetical protein [Oscillatoria sp. FACHB-1407]
MLSQIVRPMVRTQIRLLANSQATRSTLVNTIAQWLGFLGVHAQVTQLDATSNKIHVSLTVGKPEGCDAHDWQQILNNLDRNGSLEHTVPSEPFTTPSPQQTKLQRLLAYVIQVGHPNGVPAWEMLQPQLAELGFDEPTLLGIKSALKVPQSLDQLIAGLDADIAAIALPKAVSIALLDRQVNPSEDKALTALLDAMKQPVAP